MSKLFFSYILFIFGICYVHAQHTESPYTKFGDTTPTRDIQMNKHSYFMIVSISDSTYARIEVKGNVLTILDQYGIILSEQTIPGYCRSMFTSIDPQADEMTWISPYVYCFGNPVSYTDPTGESPIYSTTGEFLGTDDNGLQGDYYVMDSKNFIQSMSPDDAKKYAIDPATLSDDIRSAITNNYAGLHYRPDYDGYLTHDEANYWYRNGNGQPLYVDLSKIDLSGIKSLGSHYDSQQKVFNLLFGASHNINDALVYGNITLERHPNNTVRAKPDTYDFDIKSWNNPSTWIRNIETQIGQWVAGEGTPYNIYFHKAAPLKPLLPWLK